MISTILVLLRWKRIIKKCMCWHNLVKNSTCFPFGVSFLRCSAGWLGSRKTWHECSCCTCNPAWFTNKHSSILAIYSSSSHVAWIAVHKRRVVNGGRRVVHSSRCNVSRRRAADETLDTSLYNWTQHVSGFSWIAPGNQTVNDSHLALLTTFISETSNMVVCKPAELLQVKLCKHKT